MWKNGEKIIQAFVCFAMFACACVMFYIHFNQTSNEKCVKLHILVEIAFVPAQRYM